MASTMIPSATVATRASPAQASMMAPYTGLRPDSTSAVTKKPSVSFTSVPSKGFKTRCMQVWPPRGKKKFETLSYLPDLSQLELTKEVAYLIRSKWVPCVEFQLEKGFPYRENNRSPGYYDGRYWTMWKLPMFGCMDPAQVMLEVNECKKEYPDAFIRIIGFDNVRQVQCISFIAVKPPGYENRV